MSDKYIRVLRRMALDRSLDEDTAESLLSARSKDGGPGSGNFGHKGRPGKRGGSGAGGGSGKKETGETESSETPKKENTGSGYVNRPMKVSKTANLKALQKANQSMAKECARRAKKWPEGSQERHIYEMYSGIMSKPLSGRPTPEQSKAMTEKFLGNISSQLKPYAIERYKRDLANEPKITNDLCDIADELGTGMYGLDYRLKKASDSSDGGCRIAEKIAEDMKKKGMSYEQATDNLSDMVRYTQACTPENMASNFNRTKEALEKKGYKVVKVKNSWQDYSPERAYRGVNCVFESPNGTRFELQFHTPESLVGKEVQHGQYEEQRSPRTSEARKKELGQIMYKNMASMKEPARIDTIKPYPPD